MISRTAALPQDTAAVEQEPGTNAPRPSSRQRIARRIALAVTVISAIILLYPVIAAPITGDDRYWYLWTAVSSDGSFVDLLGYTWERLSWRVDFGRVNLLTEIERRFAALGIMETAVATSTPIPVVQGVLKLGLLAGGVLSVLAFVRSLRWRTLTGALVRASRRSLVLVGVAGTLAMAVGAQPTIPQRNGWTAYPVNTYSAIIFIFGSIALLLWLTRLVAERSKASATIGSVVALVLLAGATTLSYELAYVAVPVAALALVIIPLTDRAHAAAGRRAKLVTGAAYVGAFIPFVAAARLLVSDACADQRCYSGVQMELGNDAVRTSVSNVLSSIPGTSDNELLSALERIGWADRYPVSLTWWSVVIGAAVLVALSLVWWAMRRPEQVPNEPRSAASGELGRRQAETRLLLVGAGVTLLVAIGAAVVMGIGARSHIRVLENPGAYRNIVVTWTGIAFCIALIVVALGMLWPRRGALAGWMALTIAIGTVAAVTLPANMMGLRAARVDFTVTDAINWEVVKGDTTPEGDTRRCDLYAQIDHVQQYAREPFREFTSAAFELYHGQPFCKEIGPYVDPE